MRFQKQFVAVAVAAALISGGAFYSVSGSNLRTPQEACAAGIADLQFELNSDGAIVSGCREAATGFLEIPSKYQDVPVVAIAQSAFSGCKDLTGIYLPDTIQQIGEGAFVDAFKLTKVNIPGSVREVPVNCFAGCESLHDVELGSGIQWIGDYAFGGCMNLEEVIVPASVEYLGRNVFMNCGNMQFLEIRNPECLLNDFGCNVRVIRGYRDSTAERFANGSGFDFVELEDAPPTTDPVFCDADGDGEISAMDAQYVLTFYAEQIVGNNPSWKEITGNPNAPF